MIWVDITNQPHVLFFKDFIKKHDAFVTTRKFWALTDLLDFHDIEYTAVGSHGGKDPKKKLVESARRVSKLAEAVSKEDIDVAVSKQSVELPRVAFGLDIPAVQVVDNEYAEMQNRLALSLCKSIIVPKALDKKKLFEQGARSEQIKSFDGICEISQIKNFKPDDRVLKKHHLEEYVVVRPEPHAAAYFKGEEKTLGLINAIERAGIQTVVIPRDKKLEGGLNLRNVDTLSLIYFADAVLSGGGTMNRESALLGTPAISFYPLDLLGVDRFLIRNKLMYHSTKVKETVKLIMELKDRKREFRRRAAMLRKVMEDPFELVEKEVSSLAG